MKPAPICKECGLRRAAANKAKCNPCINVAEKARRPVEVAYRKLKANTVTRNKRRAHRGEPLIPFSITLDEFRAFCYETDILHGRGRTSTSWHVDRIIDELGYVAGNLQKLTNAENLAKEKERRRLKKIEYDYEYRTGWTREIVPIPTRPEDEPPF